MVADNYLTSRKKYEKRHQMRQEKIKRGEIKKHLIIAGVPRTGKTTTCMRLANTKLYQHICMDAVVEAFEKTYPRIGNNYIYRKS